MNKLIPAAVLAAIFLSGCVSTPRSTAPDPAPAPSVPSATATQTETAAFVASDATICAQLMGSDTKPGPLPTYMGIITKEIAADDQVTINKGLEAIKGVKNIIQRADPGLQATVQAVLSDDDTEMKAGLLEIVSVCDYDVDDLLKQP